MKNKFLVLLVFLATFLILYIIKSLFISYEDNVIYSEKVIPKYNPSNLASNYIGREDAVKRVLDILTEGFNISLNRENAYERVELHKRDEDMIWVINLVNKTQDEPNEEYYCEMEVETGEILSIHTVIKKNQDDIYTGNLVEGNEERVKEIIKPLTEKISIDISGLEMNIELINDVLVEVYFNGEKHYYFLIDYENGKVISFINYNYYDKG